MKNVHKILLVAIGLCVSIGLYMWLQLVKPQHINIKKVTTDLSLNSNELVSLFLENENEANNQFSGKIIEVEGKVKEVTFLNNRNTVILRTSNDTFGIICDFEPSKISEIEKLSINQSVKIKGICKGFLKDVVLLNCYQ